MKTLNPLFLIFIFFTSCGGTGTGNPVGPSTSAAGSVGAAESVLVSICTLLNRCNPTLTISDCESGVSAISGLEVTLGLPAGVLSNYSDVINAEFKGLIHGNTSALIQCETDIGALSCNNPLVVNAYQAGSNTPFSQVPAMIPTNANSCPDVF